METAEVFFVLTCKLLDAGPAGLISRIGIIICGSWIALLAIRLMRKKAVNLNMTELLDPCPKR